MDNRIPVIIPAYEPDEKLIKLVEDLNAAGIGPVVVVDDGSFPGEYGRIFEEVRGLGGST